MKKEELCMYYYIVCLNMHLFKHANNTILTEKHGYIVPILLNSYLQQSSLYMIYSTTAVLYSTLQYSTYINTVLLL